MPPAEKLDRATVTTTKHGTIGGKAALMVEIDNIGRGGKNEKGPKEALVMQF